jgi:hypothetical protein
MTSERIDIRTQIALDILSEPPCEFDNISKFARNRDVIKLHKTTRTGATTSLCCASIFQNKPFFVIAPTKKINTESVVEGVSRIFEDQVMIINVPSNFECIKNQQMIADNPDYAELKWLPVGGSCKVCEHYYDCPVTQILLFSFDGDYPIKGICMTYDKLAALYMTAKMYSESTAAEIIEKLKQVKVDIYDEAHVLAFDRTTTVDLPLTNENVSSLLRKVKRLYEDNHGEDYLITGRKFTVTKNIVRNYFKLLNNPELVETRTKVYNDFVSEDHVNNHKKKHSVTIDNPKYCAKKLTIKKTTDKHNGKQKTELIDETNACRELMVEVMEIIPIRKNYEISMHEINSIFDMLNVILARRLHIEMKKNDKYYFTTLTVIDHNFKEAIISYTRETQPFHQKVLVSATYPDFDYGTYFLPHTKIKDVMFGENGDPLNTNSKMMIFCDSKSYSGIGKNAIKHNIGEIVQSCIDIFEIYNPENCLIICRNIKDSKIIQKRFDNSDYKPFITYYRSPEMMGVKSNKRVAILVGLAHIPSHAYDSVCINLEESRILAEEDMYCNTWQAISRVKDPEGIEPSVVFALGCTFRDIENVVSWGTGRKPEIKETENGKATEKNVNISGEHISKPNVIEIGNWNIIENWNETLVMSIVHMFGLSIAKKIDCYKCSNLKNLNVERFSVNSKLELLNKIFGDSKYKTRFKYKNGGYSKKDIQINETIINEHISGDESYYFRPVLSKKTNTISFETDSEINLNKLKLFLDTNDTPYVIEKLNSVYRTWIFVKENTVSNAKKIVYAIIEEVGNNHKINLSDELIELPFGHNSEIVVNGQYISEFTNLKIGIIDISNFDTPSKKLNLPSADDENEQNEGDRSSSQK